MNVFLLTVGYFELGFFQKCLELYEKDQIQTAPLID